LDQLVPVLRRTPNLRGLDMYSFVSGGCLVPGFPNWIWAQLRLEKVDREPVVLTLESLTLHHFVFFRDQHQHLGPAYKFDMRRLRTLTLERCHGATDFLASLFPMESTRFPAPGLGKLIVRHTYSPIPRDELEEQQSISVMRHWLGSVPQLDTLELEGPYNGLANNITGIQGSLLKKLTLHEPESMSPRYQRSTISKDDFRALVQACTGLEELYIDVDDWSMEPDPKTREISVSIPASYTYEA
jgi:hypothetical protein